MMKVITRPWATTDMAEWTGMSTDFVLDEIHCGELRAKLHK